MSNIIDWHNHLLPYIDDGSDSLNTSLRILRISKAHGIKHVIATPHYNANRHSPDCFLEKRRASYEKLQRGLSTLELELPEIILGAEVAWFAGMGRMEEIEKLCIEGTRLLLVEMPFEQWSSYTIRELEHLISRRITPVIAHLDRYYSYQKDMDEMEALFDLPVEIQFNGDCLESFTKRRKFYQFLNKHGMCLLGTDAHNMTDRRPNLKNARNQIEKKFGPEMLAELDEYSEHLLFNR